MEMNETAEKITRALLVSVDTGEYDAESSLSELFELTQSAGAEPVASISQKLSHLEPGTCVGSGKLEEIKEFCEIGNRPDHLRLGALSGPDQEH